MTRVGVVLIVLATAGAAQQVGGQSPAAEVMELTGGQWFDGDRFVERTVYVRGGWFVRDPGKSPVRTIDLTGRYIVPPFADSHTHNLASEWGWEQIHMAYLAEGTFYVLVMANAASSAATMRDRLATRGTVDVAFGEGAVTSTTGYPFIHYEPRAMGLHDPSTWQDSAAAISRSRLMENDGYIFIDSAVDIAQKLADVLARRSSHLKIILFDSERHAELTADRTRMSHRGLDPELVPDIVSRAHAAGVRVVAHIETAYDFRRAVDAGVDVIAHAPGYNLSQSADVNRFLVDAETARLAGERGVIVTPTIHFGDRSAAGDPDWSARRDGVIRHNLTLLDRHGVTIVPGTDIYSVTARPELDALARLGIWSNAELLRMWAVSAPRVVFPGRRIGELRPGWEASFLALECDPLADFGCTRRVTMRFKQGSFLEEGRAR